MNNPHPKFTQFFTSQACLEFDRPQHNGTDTSMAAAEQVAPRVKTDGERILAAIGDGDATSFELVEQLHLPKQTITARLNDLLRAGCVMKTELRRDCPHTHAAHTVYVTTGVPYRKPPKAPGKYESGRRDGMLHIKDLLAKHIDTHFGWVTPQDLLRLIDTEINKGGNDHA